MFPNSIYPPSIFPDSEFPPGDVFTPPSPASFTLNITTSVTHWGTLITATGTNTSWTPATTFSVVGDPGASIQNLLVNTVSQTAAFLLVTSGNAVPLTVGNSTDGATVTFYVTPDTMVYIPSHSCGKSRAGSF